MAVANKSYINHIKQKIAKKSLLTAREANYACLHRKFFSDAEIKYLYNSSLTRETEVDKIKYKLLHGIKIYNKEFNFMRENNEKFKDLVFARREKFYD